MFNVKQTTLNIQVTEFATSSKAQLAYTLIRVLVYYFKPF